jgi:hypothetical protein
MISIFDSNCVGRCIHKFGFQWCHDALLFKIRKKDKWIVLFDYFDIIKHLTVVVFKILGSFQTLRVEMTQRRCITPARETYVELQLGKANYSCHSII